jgi:hypothetical protein
MIDHERFCLLVSSLFEIFRQKPSEMQLELYWQALNDLEQSLFESAVHSLIRTARFMPSPAEIRDAAREAARSRVEKTPQIDAPLLDPREDAELSETIKDLVRRFSQEKKS